MNDSNESNRDVKSKSFNVSNNVSPSKTDNIQTSSDSQGTQESNLESSIFPLRHVNMVTLTNCPDCPEKEKFKNNMTNIENILHSEFQEVYSSNDSMPALTDSDDPYTSSSENEDNEENEPSQETRVNKTTLQYTSSKNKNKYSIPAVDCDEGEMYVDKRNQFEVFRDILLKLNQTYSPEVYQLYCDLAQYDVKVPSYSQSGVSMLKEDVDKLIKQFKSKNLNEKDKQLVKECEELNKNLNEAPFNEKIKFGFKANNVTAKECRCSLTRACIRSCKSKQQECQGRCHLDSDVLFTCVCRPTADAIRNEASPKQVSDDTTVELAPAHSNAATPLSTGKYPLFVALNNLTCLNNLTNELSQGDKKTISKMSKLKSNLNKYNRRKLCNLALKYGIDNYKSASDDEVKLIDIKNIQGSGLPFISFYVGREDHSIINKNLQQGLVDSGCDANLINLSRIKHLKLKQSDINRNTSYVLRTAGGKKEEAVLGTINLTIFISDGSSFAKATLPFLVVTDDFQMESGAILGMSFIDAVKGGVWSDGSGNRHFSATMKSMHNNEIKITIPCQSLQQMSFLCNNATTCLQGENSLTMNTSLVTSNGLYHITTEDPRINIINNLCLVDNSELSTLPCLTSESKWPIQLNSETNIKVQSSEKIYEHSINFVLTKCQLPYCENKHNSLNNHEYPVNHEECTHQDEPAIVPGTTKPSKPSQPSDRIKVATCTKHNPQFPSTMNINSDSTQDCPCITINEDETMHELYLRNKEVSLNHLKTTDTINPAKTNIEESLMDKDDLMKTVSDLGKLNISHLPPASQEKVKKLTKKYSEAFSSPSKPVGRFKYFQANFTVKDAKLAKQKRRDVKFNTAPKAVKKIEEMMKYGILEEYQEEPAAVANFVLVAKPKAGSSLRLNSKADKMLARRNPELGIDYRLTVDMKPLNHQIVGVQHVALPKLAEVKDLVKGKICSAFDVQDGYTSIEVAKDSQKYMNVFYKDTILVFKRLIQGINISPNIFVAAMRECFHNDILKEFLATKQWSTEDFPYTSYEDFLLYYIDDCLCFTHIEGGEDLHLRAMEAIFHAIQRCGLLFSPKKAQIMVPELQFLGHLLTPKDSFSEMAPERAEAILSIRTPRSCGELNSRMSFWNWSAEYLPAVKLISIPLHKMAHSGVFHWGKAEAEAFTEVKLLTALRVKNHIFKPHLPQVLQTDASKVAGAFVHYQLNEDGKLELVNTQSTILAQAQIRSPSVVRESATLMWAIGASEPYLLAAEAPFIALTDCSCLQYIQRSKFHHSRFYEYSVTLSQYPKLEVLYLPGFLNATSDLLSRQFQDVLISQDSPLSEKQSRLIPPMPKELRKKVLSLSHEQLTQFILSAPPSEYIDVHDKRLLYHQPGLSKSEIEKNLISCIPEQGLFSFLLEGWQNPDIYSLPVIKDLVQKQKVLTKTSFQDIMKKWKLTHLKEKLDQLGVTENFMLKLKKTFKDEDLDQSKQRLSQLKHKKHVNAVTRSKAKKMQQGNHKESQDSLSEHSLPRSSLSIDSLNQPETSNQTKDQADAGIAKQTKPSSHKDNRGCTECTHKDVNKYGQDLVRQFSKNHNTIENVINGITQIIPFITDPDNDKLGHLMSSFHKTKCDIEKYKIFSEILPEILTIISSGDLYIRNDKDKNLDIYFYIFYVLSQDLDYIVNKNSIQFLLRDNIILEPYGFRQLNLKSFISIKCPIEIEPQCEDDIHFEANILNESGCHLQSGLLMNLTDSERTLKAGSRLFSLNFKSSQVKQFAPIEVEKQLIDNKLQILNNMSNWQSCLQWEQILAKYLNVQLKQTERKKQTPVNNILQESRLKQSPNQWCETLNGMLLAQSIHKNRGILKCEDLIKLQDSDIHLSKIKEECSKKGTFRGFITEQGILFHQSQPKDEDVCVVKLCLPNNLSQLILQSFHSVTGNHMSTSQMSKLFSSLFYTYQLSNVCKKVFQSCLVCNISQPKRKMKIYGTERSEKDVSRIGEVWFFDTAYLPPSKFNMFIGVNVYTEMLTGYSCAFPVKAISSAEAARTLSHMLCAHQGMRAISCDLGPETRGEFEKMATYNNILIHTAIPGHSNAQANVEIAIRYLKEELTKACLSSIPDKRREWPILLPSVLNNFNTRRLTSCRLSRRALFYSPLHYDALGFGLHTHFYDTTSPELHLQCLEKIQRVRDKSLGKLTNVNKWRPLFPGQIVKLIINDKEAKTTDGSRALLSTTKEYFKITDILSGGMAVRAVSLSSGDIRTLPVNDIVRIEAEDLLGLELKASDLFKDLSQARLHTAYKKMSKGLTLLKPQPDVRLNTCSSQPPRPLKNILKKRLSENVAPPVFTHPESYKAAVKAIKLSQSLGMTLSPDQETIIHSSSPFYNTNNYRNHFPADQPEDILKRKHHSRKVQFNLEEQIKTIPSNNQMWLHSIRAFALQVKYCCSKQELNVLK